MLLEPKKLQIEYYLLQQNFIVVQQWHCKGVNNERLLVIWSCQNWAWNKTDGPDIMWQLLQSMHLKIGETCPVVVELRCSLAVYVVIVQIYRSKHT